MLASDEHLQVLDTLIKMPHIGFPTDPILSLVARRNPEKALNFFFERKDFKQRHQLANDYSIWPSRLVKLSNILHNTPYEHLIEFLANFKNNHLITETTSLGSLRFSLAPLQSLLLNY